MINQQFIDGSTLLGVALSLFGIGTIVPMLWQKLVMFGCFAIYLVFANIAFFVKKKQLFKNLAYGVGEMRFTAFVN